MGRGGKRGIDAGLGGNNNKMQRDVGTHVLHIEGLLW